MTLTNRVEVKRFDLSIDGVATFAVDGDRVWMVEGQSDHFWDPKFAGPNTDKPFRLIRVRLP